MLLTGSFVFATDSTYFSCKYRYTWQKDSTNFNSKFNDVMILTINDNRSSSYYSYLKQLGNRNAEARLKAIQEGSNATVSGSSNGIVNITANAKDAANYFTLNESEAIKIDFSAKLVKVTDNFNLLGNSYGYTDTLSIPKWQISFATSIILDQKCQMATTTFKGRNYTAWFAPGIPYNMGPWLFNGLPGLILKVSDDRSQFLFECIELNTPASSTKVFKDYTAVQIIAKNKLQAKKKLQTQNWVAFQQAEDGKTITVTDKDGKPVHIADKPYNPIDLTQ